MFPAKAIDHLPKLLPVKLIYTNPEIVSGVVVLHLKEDKE